MIILAIYTVAIYMQTRDAHRITQRLMAYVMQSSRAVLKPNSITLVGSELVWSWFEAGSS